MQECSMIAFIFGFSREFVLEAELISLQKRGAIFAK